MPLIYEFCVIWKLNKREKGWEFYSKCYKNCALAFTPQKAVVLTVSWRFLFKSCWFFFLFFQGMWPGIVQAKAGRMCTLHPTPWLVDMIPTALQGKRCVNLDGWATRFNRDQYQNCVIFPWQIFPIPPQIPQEERILLDQYQNCGIFPCPFFPISPLIPREERILKRILWKQSSGVWSRKWSSLWCHRLMELWKGLGWRGT